MNIEQVDDSSDESVESSGGTENEADGCAWRAHLVASDFPATVAAAATAAL